MERRATRGVDSAGRALGALVAVLVCLCAAPDAAQAVIDDTREPSGNCSFSGYNSFTVEANIALVGVRVPNSSIKVDASNAVIVARRTTGSQTCDALGFQISSFRWSVESPPGQSAELSNAGTLAPILRVSAPGIYTARLTVCSPGCQLSEGGVTKTVGPTTREIRIEVVSEAPPPPLTDVTPPNGFQDPSGQSLPPPRYSGPARFLKCGGLGGGITKAEWVTMQRFSGIGDYRFVEGPVYWSKVADLDNFLNHSSQDFEWKVDFDSPYQGLAQGESFTRLKAEWETGSLPPRFQPTPGYGSGFGAFAPDRTSIYGLWIIDCGHPNHLNTEIHPPVGVAVQRPRPVQIPASYRPAGFPNGLGTNIWVPGVVTEIWFNRNSGRNGSCSVRTSLHQPFPRLPFPADCVGNPHSLNRKFAFNVYLPRSPQQRAQELGRNPPPTPLFIGVDKLTGGAGGPDPQVEQRDDGVGHTYLRVTVDLTGFRDATYARRLSVAWAYPSPDNWGASRWRVQLTRLSVFDDSEPFPFDDGDWRFYFNTNNRDQEWTELFRCDGCIEETTYNMSNTRTGYTGGNGRNPKGPRGLGPDVVVFPGQPIFVHTTAYDDEALGDDVGTVTSAAPQEQNSYIQRTSHYTLTWLVSPVGSVGPATLTPEALAQLRAYTANSGAQCGSGPILRQRAPIECEPSTQGAVLGGKSMRRLDTLPAFETEADEGPGQALMTATPTTFRRAYNAASARDRRALLSEIKRDLLKVPSAQRGDYNELALTLEQALPDSVARRALPSRVRKSVTRYRRRAKRQRSRKSATATAGIVRLTLGALPPRR